MRTNRFNAALLALCCLALTLVGCDGIGGRNPASTGLPYEVVLEGDSDSIVTRMMTADMPHLPQPEPMFSLKNFASAWVDNRWSHSVSLL